MRNYGAAASLLDDEHTVHAHLVEVETLVNTLRYNTSGWDLEWPIDSGTMWLAGGNVLGVQLPDEDANLEAHRLVVSVASLTQAQTSLALSQNLHGRYIAVYHAVLDASNYQIADVAREFSGRVSNLVLNKPAANQ